MRNPFRLRPIASVAGALLLSACASFSPDGGMSITAGIASSELRKEVVAIRTEEDAADARAKVVQLLKRPLSADSAVQIALLNNRGLQTAYNELGIAEAIRVRQSLPPNPSIEVTRIAGAGETELDGQIVANILALATLPMRAEMAADRFRQAQLAAALETLRVAAETRRAYYRAVAAQQLVDLLIQANSAAATAAQLAKRLGESGALNKLDQAREQSFHAEITAQLASARQRQASERERLIRSLGLWGGDLAFKLPRRLPTLPKYARALRSVEQEAVNRRVDLQIARIELETLAKSYGLTNATRFINVLEGGYADKITSNGDTVRQRALEREREWISSSPKARQAKSKARIKAYDELVRRSEDRTLGNAQIVIPAGERLGDMVIEIDHLSKAYGDRLLIDDLSFKLPPGGIVGVIGPNGAGKTTLFRMLTGQEKPDGGAIRIGETVHLGYVDQSRDDLAPNKTVWEEISGGSDVIKLGKREANSRAYVGAFNFKGGDQQQKVGTLSGGQRNRVHLAKLLKSGANVLLLDEPTNDLDTETLSALEDALEDFAGCAVIISHDRMFLDRLATHILAFEGDSHVEWFEGNFEDYEADKIRRLGPDAANPHRVKYKRLTRA